MDPDAVWGGERGRSKRSVLDGDGDRQRGRGGFGRKCGHPIVTNGDFVA